MKLHHTHKVGNNQITAYGPGFIDINGTVYSGNRIVTANSVTLWPVVDFAALTEKDFASLLMFQPAIVLLGTGKTCRFPSPRLTQALTQAQIGVEAMDIGAACRTFNILVAEDRQVVMAILHD